MSASTWFDNVKHAAHQNAPSILTGVGLGCMLGGTILAVKATPKALEKIEKKKQEDGHAYLTAGQTVEATWKCYIWAAASYIVGTGCVIGGVAESNKRQAALSLAAAAAENGIREFREYRQFVANEIGQQKEAMIHNQAMQAMVNQNPPPPNMCPERDFIEGDPRLPACCHVDFKRYFYLDYETALAAVNKLNHQITTNICGYASLNDFYYECNVEPIKMGDRIGWNQEIGLLAIPEKRDIDYCGTPGGWPCWILEFINPPKYDFNYFR